MIHEVRIFVSGTVQGVGFRTVVLRHALVHDVKGFVRNLPDGRVEICAQGTEDQIDAFIRSVQGKTGRGSISLFEKQAVPISEIHSSFDIR